MLLNADDILWNWARWCWAGATVGNMAPYIPMDDHPKEILTEHALAVDEMHHALPWHERMVIIAEYPQKNRMFGDLPAQQRMEKACRWIYRTTGVHLTIAQYKLYLGFFKNQVERALL